MKDLFIFCVSFTYQVLHPHLVRAPSLTPKTLRATITYYFHLRCKFKKSWISFSRFWQQANQQITYKQSQWACTAWLQQAPKGLRRQLIFHVYWANYTPFRFILFTTSWTKLDLSLPSPVLFLYSTEWREWDGTGGKCKVNRKR